MTHDIYPLHLPTSFLFQIMVQALHKLAKDDNHTKILRTEVARLTRQDGWSKAAIDKMHNVDSFLKEIMRLDETNFAPSFPNCMSRPSIFILFDHF